VRANTQRTTVLVLAASAVLALSGAATAESDLVSVTDPVSGCTYYVYGPDIIMYPGPKPALTVDGGAGVRAECP
jgi:hypothetical protein